MTTFDDREHAYEAAFAHDEDVHFRVRMRTARKLARWAADLMTLPAAAARRYAADIMVLQIHAADDATLHGRIGRDLQEAGCPVSGAEIARQAESLRVEAEASVRAA